MVTIEPIAEAAVRRDSLVLRALVQHFLRSHPKLDEVPCPQTADPLVLATAAGLLELFAQRADQPAPGWTNEVGALAEPYFLVEAASRMKRLRLLCESESPESLRKRRIYAPPNFLDYA